MDESNTTPLQTRKAARFRYRRPRRGPWVQLFDVVGFEWNLVELEIDGLPAELDGARIVHIGDLHLRARWSQALDELIARLKQDPPDLLLFTGDFVDDKQDHSPALPRLQTLLTSIHAKSGAFATLGNHDGDLLLPRLMAAGVRVITHERLIVRVRGADVELIGFPGPDRLDLNDAFLHGLPEKTLGVPRIVLSHYPDLIRAARAAGLAPDLFLAGHTHGGQVCLPTGVPIYRHDSLPRKLCRGAHDFGGTCLVVTRGMGFSTLPVRVFCPAEVVEIVLKREA